jgi:hypothetical protein
MSNRALFGFRASASDSSQDARRGKQYAPALLFGFVAVLLAAYVLAVLFGPILRGDDTFISLSHLGIWTAALRAGDPLSIWTPGDANGFGSPVPFFYHKLFNLVGAFAAIASGNVVTGFRLAVLMFSAVMFYGTYACAGRLGADRLSRWVIATACVLAPYAIDNIVERCAVSEYAAMALIPPILALTIDFLKARDIRKWHGVAVFVLLLLLALAHLLIFVVTAALLLLLSFALIARSSAGSGSLAVATLAALALFAAFIYVPFSFWATYFSPAQARAYGLPAEHVLPLRAVLLPLPDSRAGWPVIGLVIGMAMQLRVPREARASLAVGLGMVALGLTLLMTRLATPLWRLSDQLDFVQFPWRLLAIATPLCFVAMTGLIEKLSVTARRCVQFGLLTISLFNTLGMLYMLRLDHTILPIAELQNDAPTAGIGRDAGGEYFPAVFQPKLAPLTVWLVPVASVLPARRPLIEGSGCTFAAIERPAYFDQLRIPVTCSTGGHVRVNQFSTPFLDSMALGANGSTMKPLGDGPLIDFSLPAGEWTVVIKQRTYLNLVMMSWRARFTGSKPGSKPGSNE